MNWPKVILSSVIFLSVLACNHTTTYCNNNREIGGLKLMWFTLDSTFQCKNTKIDTNGVKTKVEFQATQLVENSIRINFQYPIKLVDDSLFFEVNGKNYLLSNLEFGKTVVHDMFSSLELCELKSYKVNGEVFTNTNLLIYKKYDS